MKQDNIFQSTFFIPQFIPDISISQSKFISSTSFSLKLLSFLDKKNDKEQSEATVEKKLSPVILQTSSSVLL